MRLTVPFIRFINEEKNSGVVLLLSVVAAVVWANSPWSASYHHLWETPVRIGFGEHVLDYPLHFWINDGLMCLFFFVIGLELKREFRGGELSTAKKAALPMVAAFGGMVVPALIFLLFNPAGASSKGWGIPMATDIAFALSLLSLSGKHIPASLKVFLSALAVADDLGAVLVIAFFYTAEIHITYLVSGLFVVLLLFAGNRTGIRSFLFYLIFGGITWLCFLYSGVHATIAGVLVAFTIPSGNAGEPFSPSLKMGEALHPWVAFLIMPLFALANSGIIVHAGIFAEIGSAISMGVGLGLVAGKFIGVLGFTRLFCKLKLGGLPGGVSWTHMCGAALLAGVGFTMSLFITGLAFNDPQMTEQAKYGILLASVIAGMSGVIYLRRVAR
jgi:NhaA family Na+:H+ antiporter